MRVVDSKRPYQKPYKFQFHNEAFNNYAIGQFLSYYRNHLRLTAVIIKL